MAQSVLVVEDDVHTRMLLRAKLQSSGINVVLAPTGKTALELVNTRSFDAIVIDLILPDISGRDLLSRIRNNVRTRSVPVLILSVKSLEDDVLEAFSIGANDYMKKPFSPSEVVARLKEIIAKSAKSP